MAKYTKKFYATQDTYIDRSLSSDYVIGTNTNYDGRTYLKMGEGDDGARNPHTAFFGIDFTEIKYKKILNAHMYIKIPSFSEEYTGQFREYTIKGAWKANEITALKHPIVDKYYWGDSDNFQKYSGDLYRMGVHSSLKGSQKEGYMSYGYAISPHWAGNHGVYNLTSIEGGFATYVEVEYEDSPPLQPNIYEPINIYINNIEPVLFKWKYNSEIPNDYQQGIELRGKHELGTWKTLYNSTTLKATEVSIAGSNFDTGKWEWQLRTRNQFGEYSPWSEIVYFNALGLPKAPVVTVQQEGSRPIINWTATYQQVYQVQILNSKNEIVHNSGSIASLSNKTYKIPIFMENGNYTARVRIKNEFDLFSNWGTKTFTINITEREPFDATIYPVDDFVFIKPNYAANYFLIYRSLYGKDEYKRIARFEGDSYKDYTPKGNEKYIYFVRAVIAEEFVDSKKVVLSCYLKYPVIAEVSDLSKRLQIRSNIDEPLKRNYSLLNESEKRFYMGRTFPVTHFSEFKNNSYNLTFHIKEHQLKDLEELYNKKNVILYRDNYRKMYCTVENGIDVKIHSIGGYTISMNILETDYEEGLNG